LIKQGGVRSLNKKEATFMKAKRVGRLTAALLLFFGWSLLLWFGCSPAEPSVSGTVLVDGQPLGSGSIRFVPVNNTPGPDAGTSIREGEYRIDKGLRVGEYQVKLRGVRPARRQVQDPLTPKLIRDAVSIVPPDFSPIRAIQPGSNTMNFELKGLDSKDARAGK
jgi:hypothetical protein